MSPSSDARQKPHRAPDWPFGHLRRAAMTRHPGAAMSSPLLVIRVCLVASFGIAAPRAVAAAPAVRVEVDVEILNEAVESSVRHDATAWFDARIAAAGFVHDAEAGDAAKLEIRDFDREQGLGYAGVVRLDVPPGHAAIEIRAGCACSGHEFFERLGAAFDDRAAEWSAAHAEAPPQPAPRPAPVPEAPPPATRYRVGVLGGMGIGMMALGVGGTVLGAVMWKRASDRGEPPSDPDGDGLGAAVIAAAGGFIIAGGVASVVADFLIERGPRRRVRPRAQVGRDGGGLVLTGRF